MPSSYEVKASTIFDAPPDVVFDFLLFFFRLNPDSRFLGQGSITEPDRTQVLKQNRETPTSPGSAVATRWDYPKLLLLEKFTSPFLKRDTLEVTGSAGGTKVTWRYGNEAKNFFEKLGIAMHRRGLDQLTAMHQGTLDKLLHEFESRNHSGVGEHFEAFRSELHGSQRS